MIVKVVSCFGKKKRSYEDGNKKLRMKRNWVVDEACFFGSVGWEVKEEEEEEEGKKKRKNNNKWTGSEVRGGALRVLYCSTRSLPPRISPTLKN